MALSYVKTNGDGATTNFAVPFSYLDKTHIHVYVGGVEKTFTWVNSATVQISPAPAVGTLNVEIRRQTPRDVALVDYNNGSVLFDTDLDTANLQSLFIAQEYFEQAESAFPSGHAIDSHSDATPGESVLKGAMRVYDYQSKLRAVVASDGGLLIGDAAENNGVRFLPKGTDGYTLEVDDAVPGKLAWKQGLRKVLTTAGDMLVATAAGVAARLAIGTTGYLLSVVGGVPAWVAPSLNGFTTGDGKLTLKNVADAGWVMANDGTIGNASSGATTRANADTQDLYTLLWNNVSDTYAPVSTGRGVSAAADFAANKTIALTKQLGRAIAIAGTGSGLTARALGETLGSEGAVVVQHNHGITDPGHGHNITYNGSGAYGGTSGPIAGSSDGLMYAFVSSANTTGITVNSSGESGTGKNMQPTSFWNVMIKL